MTPQQPPLFPRPPRQARLLVRCAENGDLDLQLLTLSGRFRFSGFPWLIPLPDVGVYFIEAILPDRLMLPFQHLLYCELARVAAGQLVIDADHLPLDTKGRFPPCDYLRLALAEYAPQSGRWRTTFTVRR